MSKINKILLKVVFILILLFLCFSLKPVSAEKILGHEVVLDPLNPFRKEKTSEEKRSDAITQAIDDEDGGLFESTIAKALGGIAKAVFNIASSDEINLGFKSYDSLIFNKNYNFGFELEEISPFNMYDWSKIMTWYKTFSSLSFIFILIGAVITSYKFIIAGTNVTSRNEAKDSFFRLFIGGAAIVLAPVFVKMVLMINNNMVSALVSSSSGELNSLLGNDIFTQIKTGSAIATALVICLFAYLFAKLNIKFIIRKFTLIVFIVFTPLIAGMWIINKNVTGAAIWFGQIIINAFMQFVYAFLFLIYLDFTSTADGWAVSLLWAMMILPLGDVLLNTMQNLTSRIAGFNNEEMANRGIGMGAAMLYTIHSIGKQFTSNNSNVGFINRIKSYTNRNEDSKLVEEKKPINKKSDSLVDKDNEKSNRKSGISLYGIGRSFLNTGMFMAEGRNFSNSGITGNKHNYEKSMRKNEITNSLNQNNVNLENQNAKKREVLNEKD